MSKEIELKYRIDESKTEKILKDLYKLFESPIKEEKMKAIYFDTKDFILLKNGIALRIREEGSETIATVKTQGTYENGLFSRKEWNVNITNKEYKTSLEQLFSQTEIGSELIHIITDKELDEKMITTFARKKATVSINDSKFEIAMDKGEIVAGNKKEDISEMEIELLEGTETSLIDFGNKLVYRYNLRPEKLSKYARGLNLLRVISD